MKKFINFIRLLFKIYPKDYALPHNEVPLYLQASSPDKENYQPYFDVVPPVKSKEVAIKRKIAKKKSTTALKNTNKGRKLIRSKKTN